MILIPLADPILIFLLVLLTILFATLLNRVHIPQIIGLILAGVAFGPHGFGVLADDQTFAMLGEVGLLYIMFQVGLDVDIHAFKLQKRQGIYFGAYTLLIPLALGMAGGMIHLGMRTPQALLFSAMMSCHTLIAYPIINKMGVNDNRAVNIVITGTIVAVTASLIIMAGVMGYESGDGLDKVLWIIAGTAVFAFFVFWILPRLAKWYFAKFSDGMSQYVFVLACALASSVIAHLAGLEGILGAFFAGLVLNKYIKPASTLMTRILFMGNVLFIPFFLIKVGMQINTMAFLNGTDTLKVAGLMITIALSSKWLAAKLIQQQEHLTKDEGDMIFGLTSGKAAASLAAVMLGAESGLFDDNIMNGTVIMILVTVTVSTITTERSARRIARERNKVFEIEEIGVERIMISVSNPATLRGLIEFGAIAKRKELKENLYALKVISSEEESKAGGAILKEARKIAAESENGMRALLRQDLNVANCMVSVAKQHYITDIIVGVHKKANIIDTFLGHIIKSIVRETTDFNLLIYGARGGEISAITRMVVVVYKGAEKEMGFKLWLERVNTVAKQGKMSIEFLSKGETLIALEKMHDIFKEVQVTIKEFEYETIDRLTGNDLLTVLMARKSAVSYFSELETLPHLLQRNEKCSYLIIYPRQTKGNEQKWSKLNPFKIE